jgi:hypothetical protein
MQSRGASTGDVDHSLEWLFQLGDVNETSYPKFILDVGALAMCHDNSHTPGWSPARVDLRGR